LDGIVLDEGSLDVVEVSIGALYAFDGCDFGLVGLDGEEEAGVDGFLIEEDSACAAFSTFAACFGPE
jgi:phosphoglucomutase